MEDGRWKMEDDSAFEPPSSIFDLPSPLNADRPPERIVREVPTAEHDRHVLPREPRRQLLEPRESRRARALGDVVRDPEIVAYPLVDLLLAHRHELRQPALQRVEGHRVR